MTGVPSDFLTKIFPFFVQAYFQPHCFRFEFAAPKRRLVAGHKCSLTKIGTLGSNPMSSDDIFCFFCLCKKRVTCCPAYELNNYWRICVTHRLNAVARFCACVGTTIFVYKNGPVLEAVARAGSCRGHRVACLDCFFFYVLLHHHQPVIGRFHSHAPLKHRLIRMTHAKQMLMSRKLPARR